MITKMKKLTLFLTESEIGADITLLGYLGVVHITPFQQPADESIDRVYNRILQMKGAIALLEEYQNDTLSDDELKIEIEKNEEFLKDEVNLMQKVLKAGEARERLRAHLQHLNDEKVWYNEWGEVSMLDVKDLEKRGVFMKLYLLNRKELDSVKTNPNITVVGHDNEMYRVVHFSDNKDEQLDFEEIKKPKFRNFSIDACIDEAKKDIEKNRKKLQLYYSKLDLLRDALDERYRRYNVRNVQFGGYLVDDKFSCWNGYIPEKYIDGFIETADKNNWGYLIENPTDEELEDVPTEITSPKWADSIRPVMNFMGLVPGYDEIDVSKVFMIFFTFFSGILVGDAGYGLVFLLITLLVHFKQKFKPKIEFGLMYTLSASIMLWGILTGTYFGVEELASIPVLSDLVVDKIASFGGDEVFLQKFMFILGAVHLTIGHLQAAFKYINSVRAIAQLGWISIVWGLYFFINKMVLSIPAPDYMNWFFIAGVGLIALFANPGKNFFKGIVSSLADLPLSVISGFSDIISYIRLYAVGLATVLMAVSFNEMAIGEGITTVVSAIVAILILILGHGLNMILAAMAVIVHGVRLNMLEYASHAGVEFSGSEYAPFKIKQNNNNNLNL